ncbi:hypothetical protein FN846DRAFT_902074 [Sphaerosporella brunnea]|uniref:Uncharacterized protein n=1 Tax=Sphaerosporella brunnea TaxID=1250544 RepID=A0A5J5FA32_9PEZI|nr:hypothetical protein FN846DRAFT_902074 [Sphaerosporella brunnea]
MAQNNPASTTLTLESLPFDIHVELLVTLLSAEGLDMDYSHEYHLIPLLVASPTICQVWEVCRSAIRNRVASDQLARIKDDVLSRRRTCILAFFSFKVWYAYIREDLEARWQAYDHLLPAIAEYKRAWKNYAGILISVLQLRFWLAPAYNPPKLEWSRTLPKLRSLRHPRSEPAWPPGLLVNM